MNGDLDVDARSGTEYELDVLAQIRADQFTAVAEARGGALLVETDRALNGADHSEHLVRSLASDNCELVVGTLDGYPFGYGLLSFASLGPGRVLGVIDELLVEPDAREVGLGETIMNELVVRATSRDCFGIDSRALPGDRETKNFFESFGLKARMLIVHRALDRET